MTEPILSREEVQEIQRKCDITFFVPDDSETWPGTYINLQQLRDYTARIESAILEKLCGEPVAWQWRKTNTPWSLDLTFNSEVFATMDGTEVRPLYALNRSKA